MGLICLMGSEIADGGRAGNKAQSAHSGNLPLLSHVFVITN